MPYRISFVKADRGSRDSEIEANHKMSCRSNRVDDVSSKFCKNGDDLMDNEIHLRAPIPKEHGYPELAHKGEEEWVIQSSLCRMYVACEAMKLGLETRFTAMVLFHRYVLHYFQMEKQLKNDWKHLGTVAASCLFLGCKIEEEPRRIRDVINISHILDFSAPPKNKKMLEISPLQEPPLLDDLYWESKKVIVDTEQHVLRMLQFDTNVSHPYRAILALLHTLQKQKQLSKTEDTIQKKSFQYINNCIFYEPALRVPILPLACAAINLAMDDDPNDTAKIQRWEFLTHSNEISHQDLIIAKTTILKAEKSLLHQSETIEQRK